MIRRRAGIAILAGVLATAGIGAVQAARPQHLDGDPARWRPIHLVDVADVLPTTGPATPGSPEDRAELDALALGVAAASPAAREAAATWLREGAVHVWLAVTMEAIRDERLNPVRASRLLAYVSVALYDTAIAVHVGADPGRPIVRERDARFATRVGAPAVRAALLVAQSEAAAGVLSALLDRQDAPWRATLAAAVASPADLGLLTASERQWASSIGRAVAARLAARAATDGADRVDPVTPPNGPDTWRPQAADSVALEPHAGDWAPWLLVRGDALRPPPPPPVGSSAWTADARELETLRAGLTTDQLVTVRFWADGMGTVTPAGHWLLVALDLAAAERLGPEATARVAAYVSVAQADAFIACWDAKYAYWTARPIQLLNGFVSAIPTPPFPAFPSGHSTQSSAAATVIVALFPAERAGIEALARESSESRILGGLHWRIDAEVGIEVGRRIGELSVARLVADD